MSDERGPGFVLRVSPVPLHDCFRRIILPAFLWTSSTVSRGRFWENCWWMGRCQNAADLDTNVWFGMFLHGWRGNKLPCSPEIEACPRFFDNLHLDARVRLPGGWVIARTPCDLKNQCGADFFFNSWFLIKYANAFFPYTLLLRKALLSAWAEIFVCKL